MGLGFRVQDRFGAEEGVHRQEVYDSRSEEVKEAWGIATEYVRLEDKLTAQVLSTVSIWEHLHQASVLRVPVEGV